MTRCPAKERRTGAWFVLTLTLSISLLLAITISLGGAAADSTDEHHLYPVSQAEGMWPNQDGQNVYYDVAPHPADDVHETLVPPRGFNELVVYHEHSFHAHNYDVPQHFRAADWHPDGEYALLGGGQLMETEFSIFRYEDGDIEPVSLEPGGDVMDVSFNERGEALLVGYITAQGGEPVATQFVYTDDGREFREFELPRVEEIRSVDWSPDGDQAIAVGPRGTIFIYEDEEVHDETIEEDVYFRSVEWHEDGATIVGSEDMTSLGFPDGDGVIYERDGDIGRTTTTEATIEDLAVHADGDHALLAGGFHEGAMYRYDRDTAEVISLDVDSDRLFGVDWITDEDALVVGDEEIWRYSTSTPPEDLPPTASFTVNPRNPDTDDTIELLGFGSTSQGSADRVQRWRFDYGQDDPSWSESRRVEIRYLESGIYDVSLTVEDVDGERSEPVNRTVTVLETDDGADHGDVDGDDDGALPTPGFNLAVAALALVLAASARFHSHRST